MREGNGMTYTERKQPKFSVKDDVYIFDTEVCDPPKWVHGVVKEVGDETVLIQWDDFDDPTDYELSDLPDIRFKPQDERFDEIQKLKTELDFANAQCAKKDKVIEDLVKKLRAVI